MYRLFIAARGLSLAAASRVYFPVAVLRFGTQALRHMASVDAGSSGDVDHGDVQSSQERGWEQNSWH